MSLKKTKKKGLFRSGSFDRDEYEADLENLATFYKNNGFRDFEVKGDSISYSENKKRMFLTIRIDEGTKYVFGDVTFDGNVLFDDENEETAKDRKLYSLFENQELDSFYEKMK